MALFYGLTALSSYEYDADMHRVEHTASNSSLQWRHVFVAAETHMLRRKKSFQLAVA
jgi:hypothetical protein